METNILSQRSHMRGSKAKIKAKVISVVSTNYITDFVISLKFNTGEDRVIDFLPLFHKYVKGVNLKYFSIKNFKGFFVKNGNIFLWRERRCDLYY